MEIDPVQEDALVGLLNTTPVVGGAAQDLLADPRTAAAWQREHAGSGGPEERAHLVEARDALQDVVRGLRTPSSLSGLLHGVRQVPDVTDEGVGWHLDVPPERRAAVRAVLAWSELHRNRPGRLRPCANPDCRLFLLDRSKANKARWCSMAVCGNRMKARRHHQRVRETAADAAAAE